MKRFSAKIKLNDATKAALEKKERMLCEAISGNKNLNYKEVKGQMFSEVLNCVESMLGPTPLEVKKALSRHDRNKVSTAISRLVIDNSMNKTKDKILTINYDNVKRRGKGWIYLNKFTTVK